jgi:hypothetical protein
MNFRQKLRELIEKHIGPSSTFKDYLRITTDPEEEQAG